MFQIEDAATTYTAPPGNPPSTDSSKQENVISSDIDDSPDFLKPDYPTRK